MAVKLDGGIDEGYWSGILPYGMRYSGWVSECGSAGTESNAGDTLTLSFYGNSLKAVNAISVAIPYDQSAMEYAGVEASGRRRWKT